MAENKDNQGMSDRTRYLLAAMLICSALLLGVVAPVKAADLSTDKGDYAPWETVYISGEGFSPGATVTMTVEWPAPDGGTYEVLPAPTADDAGRITAEYALMGDPGGCGLEGTYIVVAVDSVNGQSVSTTFTDAYNPPLGQHWVIFQTLDVPGSELPAGTFISVTYDGYITYRSNAPWDYYFATETKEFQNRYPLRTEQGKPFTYRDFSPTAVAGGVTYTFASVSESSPITSENGGSYSYVNAKYVKQVAADPPVPTINDAPSISPEGTPITLIGSVVYQGTVDYTWSVTKGGAAYASGTDVSLTFTPDDNAEYVVTLTATATDKDNCKGTTAATIEVTNVAPTSTGTIAVPSDPVKVGSPVSSSASFTDPGTADTHTALWTWEDDSTSAGVVTESEASGSVSGSHTYGAAGIYTVKVQVTDKDGGVDDLSASSTIVVYDPSAGFVTGGGWFSSPAGAYVTDPATTGKGYFAFVSTYKKDANVPGSSAMFHFKADGLDFESTSNEWLVITGAKATYKGAGILNGAGNYEFLLSAIDGSPDRIRIKIWDNVSGDVAYDNMAGMPDGADPTMGIGGGNIVVHS